MGIVFRQSIKTTIVVFTGNFIGALINYFSAFVFKDDLQQFGFARTMINIGAIFQFIVLLGSSAVIQIYIQRYSSTDIRKRVLLTICAIIPVIVTLALMPFYLIFRDNIIQLFQSEDHFYFSRYYLWIPLLILIWSYITLYESYLLSQQKTAKSIFMREILLRLCNLCVLGAFYYKLISFHYFIILTIGCYFFPALSLLFLALQTKGFGFSLRWKAFSKSEYLQIAHFSWYHLLMGISFFLIGFIDTLMLASLDHNGVASVPVYTIAVFIVTVMTIPYRAMANAAFPVLNQAYIDQDSEKLRDFFRRSSINIMIVATAMLLMIGFNLNNMVAVLPRGYQAISSLVLILVIGRMADMVTGLNNEMISISNLYKFNFHIAILLVVIVAILDRIFIPKYGVFGAAWGATISLVIFNVVKMIFLYRKMKIFPFSLNSIKVMCAGVITALIIWLIPLMINAIADFFLRTAIILIIYTLFLIWLRPSEDLNLYLTSVKKNKRLF